MECKKILLNKTKSLNMLYTSSKGYGEYVAVHEQKKKTLNRNQCSEREQLTEVYILKNLVL